MPATPAMAPAMTKVCETPRLLLRHFALTDAEFILHLLNEPSFIRYIADKGVRTLDDARTYLETGPLASYAAYGFGLNLIALKDSGVPIGMCGILKREHLPEPDLGYALLPEYWSRGYALEAALAIISHARQVIRLPRLLAVTDADNGSSIRLLEKSGFRFAHPLRLAENESDLKLFELEVLPSALA